MNFTKMWAVAVIFAVCISITASAEETNDAKTETDGTDSYVSPKPSGNVYFAEHFDSEDEFEARWVRSQAKKEGIDETIAKYDGKWAVESPLKGGLKGDTGLVLKSKAKHAAISASLDKPFYFTDKPLIVQYEITFQSGQDCGGAYIKLLTHNPELRLSQFTDKTQYTIMFGPDKCGNDQKLHFIFQHKNPKNGTFSEKHAKKASVKLDDYFKDGKPHLYTLMVHPDNTYYISIDYKIVNQGTLLDDFSPPVNPPAQVDDPEDRKPADWDEREKIPDPEASKPEDWDEDQPERISDPSAVKPSGWLDDEPPMIPDPSAEKPEDWDEDMDGTWEAPLIDNPACQSAPGCGEWKAPLIANPLFKGKWRPPLIDNPNYKGKWHPRKIPNPDFFEDKHPFNMEPIGAVGLELWSMSDNILFDNFVITDDKRVAEDWAADTFDFRNKVISDQPLSERLRRWLNHAPNAIMVYAMYLSLPVTLYVWYLRRTVVEDSVVERLIKYTRNRPWLWAVYFLVIGIPAVLIVTFLCTGQEQKEKIRAARAKKDEDDAAAAAEDDQVAAAAAAAAEESKADKEKEVADEKEDNEAEEADEKEEEEETREEAPREEKQSPRRRRTRKD